jgi:hypothetical protein
MPLIDPSPTRRLLLQPAPRIRPLELLLECLDHSTLWRRLNYRHRRRINLARVEDELDAEVERAKKAFKLVNSGLHMAIHWYLEGSDDPAIRRDACNCSRSMQAGRPQPGDVLDVPVKLKAPWQR